MKPAYLLTKPDGSTVLLFNGERAKGLAAHFGWSIRFLTALEAQAFIRASLKDSRVA